MSVAPAALQSNRSPWGLSSARLGMVAFLISDALTFLALFVAAGVLRHTNPGWPRPFTLSPTGALVAAMTVVLVASGLAMRAAVRQVRQGDARRAANFMLVAVTLGLVFLGLHASEWRHWMHAGMTLRQNAWGVPLFGATFYTLTGFHMAHVLGGIVAVSLFGARLRRVPAAAAGEGVALVSLYWHFVEVVWLFVVVFVYAAAMKVG